MINYWPSQIDIWIHLDQFRFPLGKYEFEIILPTMGIIATSNKMTRYKFSCHTDSDYAKCTSSQSWSHVDDLLDYFLSTLKIK